MDNFRKAGSNRLAHKSKKSIYNEKEFRYKSSLLSLKWQIG